MDSPKSALWCRPLLALAVLGGGVWRFWYALSAHRPISFDYSDMHGYISVARRIADPELVTNIYDWYYPRGTAFVLSLFVRAAGEAGWVWAAGFQALLGTVQIFLVYLIARRLFNSQVGAAAALGMASHYLAVSYGGFFLSENYLSFALALGFACLAAAVPGRCAAAGVAFGLAAWVKPQAIAVAVLAAAWLLLRQRRFASGVALLLGAACVVIPASVITSRVAGRPAFISLNGGQTFCLSQCPFQTIRAKTADYEMAFGLPSVVQRSERAEEESHWTQALYNVSFVDNSFYLHEGLKCMAQDPWRAVKLAALHLADIFCGPFWSHVYPWPDSATRWKGWAAASNLWLSYGIAPLAFWGMWRSRRHANALLLFVPTAGAVLASALIFHGDPRFRVPYDFVLFIAAAAALSPLVNRATANNHAAEPPRSATPGA